MCLLSEKDGLNSHREKENQKREIDVRQALLKFTSTEWDILIDEYTQGKYDGCDCFLSPPKSKPQKTPAIKPETNKKSQKSLESPKFYQVHCRNCCTLLFPAQDLKYRQPSYYSVNKNFKDNLITYDKACPKSFYCAKKSCGRYLGQKVVIRKQPPLFLVSLSGVKFSKIDRPGFDTPSKWSNIKFEVDNLINDQVYAMNNFYYEYSDC